MKRHIKLKYNLIITPRNIRTIRSCLKSNKKFSADMLLNIYFIEKKLI